jgi:hypothetical protein
VAEARYASGVGASALLAGVEVDLVPVPRLAPITVVVEQIPAPPVGPLVGGAELEEVGCADAHKCYYHR